jgi:hypothetical protein
MSTRNFPKARSKKASAFFSLHSVVRMIIIFLAVVILGACQAAPASPTTTPVPPTATLRPRTPTPVLPLASSPEDLVGYWKLTAQNLPFYFRYYPDGTYHGAFYLDEIEGNPQLIGEYRFEGTQLFLRTIWQREDFPPGCDETMVGIYQVQMLENGNRNYVYVQDNCAGRRRGIDGIHEPRFPEV